MKNFYNFLVCFTLIKTILTYGGCGILNPTNTNDCLQYSTDTNLCCHLTFSKYEEIHEICGSLPINGSFIADYITHFSVNVRQGKTTYVQYWPLHYDCGDIVSNVLDYACGDNSIPSGKKDCTKFSKTNEKCCYYENKKNPQNSLCVSQRSGLQDFKSLGIIVQC